MLVCCGRSSTTLGDMKPELKSALRSLALCALVPGVIATFLSPLLGILVFIAAFVLASIVGYPAFLLLRRYGKANVWLACLVGLLIGAGLGGNMFWPLKYPELKTTSWRGSDEHRIYTMVNGVPTQVAWNDFYVATSVLGLLGMLTGLAFWLCVARPSGETLPGNNKS